MSTLMKRVLTALVLLALLLPAMFAQRPEPFAALTLLMIAAAGWEWARLHGWAGASAAVFGVVVAALGACAWWMGWKREAPVLLWWLGVLVWTLGGAWALAQGAEHWHARARRAKLVIGGVLLVGSWLALASAKTVGLNFLLSVFCVVWVSDIAAFAAGKAFGRHKLAPRVSPGKTWEGVAGGTLGVLVLAACWLQLEAMGPSTGLAWDGASLFARLHERLGWVAGALALVMLVAMGVVGDLLESLVKRAAGVKDSSQLLPGHGGVLDRIDALLPVFPIALALASLPA